ncbi:MAG: ABC transporter ATP-binding protein [Clostridiales bacterium]|jgi:cobalt/nickel transport system ATP-binding protein|nr:ABC transporter ATP-binding protein [Clostridiales bacterium]
MIRFEHVSCEYEKGQTVLNDLSFEIQDGESVGLIGANGAGKSTLMKVLLGLLPYSGRILVDDLEVNKANLKEIRRKMGFVLQNSDNQMFMPTVFEDIMFAPLNYGMTREEAEKRTEDTLNELGLSNLKHRHNHKISGGEKKMAAIATVLAMDPGTLLMDEPTSALDPYNRRIVINTINKLNKTKIIASHDLDMILDTCRRVILLSNGSIAADDGAENVLTDQILLEKNRMELPLSYSHMKKQ